MERKSKSGPFKMKSPLKNTGTMLPEVKVSGGKKTKKGTFIQDERGSSIAGSSIEHDKLRKKDKASRKEKGSPKLTSKERARLRELNLATQKAYKKSATKMKKSPAKAGQTAGQIIRRERHMV
jgi:hypothetical protein